MDLDALPGPTEEQLKELDPNEEDDSRVLRITAPYEDCSERFQLKSKKFSQQYSHIYNKRLLQLRAPCEVTAALKFGDSYAYAARAIALEVGQKCYLVGTLYKTQKLKPSVLDEFKDDVGIVATVEPLSDYTADDDSLVLEDESGRVALASAADWPDALPVQALSTGLVVAVAGVLDDKGTFGVEAYCAPGPAPYPILPTSPSAMATTECGKRHVLLVSGFDVGGCADPLPASMLCDFVSGNLGGPEDIALAATIVRVIFCGNGRAPVPSHMLANAKLTSEALEKIHGPMSELDALLSVLASSLPLDVMPGATDPAGHWLPQQPLPACVLPHTNRYSTLQRCTNPYDATIGGRRFLGSSGQPIEDLRKFNRRSPRDDEAKEGQLSASSSSSSPQNDAEEAVAWLSDMLQWRHCAPTAPDTLDTYPFFDTDPFVIEDTPHVFFTGNQTAFACARVPVPGNGQVEEGGESATCIAVPRFSTTGQAVLLDLDTLDCAPISFKSALPSSP